MISQEKLDRIRYLADLISWAGENIEEPWGGAPDYLPGSIMDQYLAELDPDTVLALVEAAETQA